MKALIKTVVTIGLVLTSLTGCEEFRKGKLVSSSFESMTMTEFDRPKHASAVFTNDSGKEFYTRLGKRCSNWHNTAVEGNKYMVKVDHYELLKEDGTIKKTSKINYTQARQMICHR
nr:hypothetical protein [Vibrio splendidus]MCC4881878.1 hypothetical protein [Vibrio splendidus]